MINLLPPSEQAKRRAEYGHRLLLVAGELGLIFLVIVSIILASLYWALTLKRALVEENLATVTKRLAQEDVVGLRTKVETTNERIRRLSAPLVEVVPVKPSLVLARLADPSFVGIELRQVNYIVNADASAAIGLTGRSPSRQGFLNYLEFLRSNSLFAAVESPVENLIREKDLDFTLKLIAKPVPPEQS